MEELRLLVAGDAHLGYRERDSERRGDSFAALEEALRLARSERADAVVLLGDLFHESNTSLATINSCIDLLEREAGRKRPLASPLDLDRPDTFCLAPGALPLFLIHGNHDLPLNEAKSGSLDILDKSGHVKFLGKLASFDVVEVEPFALHKGGLRVGLYPLGFIKDNKLNYLLRNGRIRFAPGEGLHRRLLLLHQNRSMTGVASKDCLDLSLLPEGFFDLLLWGHEHESIPRIIEQERHSLRIYQPGSTVPTSLRAFEAKPKHVGLLRLDQAQIFLQPHFLQQQRRMVIDETVFARAACPPNRGAEEFIAEEVVRRHGLGATCALLPLVRVRVSLAEDESINHFQLEMLLRDFVANKGEVFAVNRHRPALALNAREVLDCIVSKQPLHKADRSTLRAVEARIHDAYRAQPPLRVLSLEAVLELLHAHPEGLKPAVFGEMIAKSDQSFREELDRALEGRRSSFAALRERFPRLIAEGVGQESFESFFTASDLKEEVAAVFAGLRKRRSEQSVEDLFAQVANPAAPPSTAADSPEHSAAEDLDADFASTPPPASPAPHRRRAAGGRPPPEKRTKRAAGNLTLNQLL